VDVSTECNPNLRLREREREREREAERGMWASLWHGSKFGSQDHKNELENEIF
jgi:hypothetical protein